MLNAKSPSRTQFLHSPRAYSPAESVSANRSSQAQRPRNHVLQALPVNDWERLAPQMRHALLIGGQSLHRAGQATERVYFPNAGLVSLVAESDGASVEVAAVGRNGMIGALSDLSSKSAFASAVVGIPGNALWLPAGVVYEEFQRGGALRDIMLRHTAALLAETARSALCNRLHSVEERLSRWLLSVGDYTDCETIDVTHENIARLLGTRRSGVTVALGAFAESGLIDTSRGHVTILAKSLLQDRACSCYRKTAATA